MYYSNVSVYIDALYNTNIQLIFSRCKRDAIATGRLLWQARDKRNSFYLHLSPDVRQVNRTKGAGFQRCFPAAISEGGAGAGLPQLPSRGKLPRFGGNFQEESPKFPQCLRARRALAVAVREIARVMSNETDKLSRRISNGAIKIARSRTAGY